MLRTHKSTGVYDRNMDLNEHKPLRSETSNSTLHISINVHDNVVRGNLDCHEDNHLRETTITFVERISGKLVGNKNPRAVQYVQT